MHARATTGLGGNPSWTVTPPALTMFRQSPGMLQLSAIRFARYFVRKCNYLQAYANP